MLNILVKNISKRLPDAWHHQVKYALYFKKLPHLSKPTGFSEKIMRRKIYPAQHLHHLVGQVQGT